MNEPLTAGWRYRLLTRLLSPLLVGHATWKTIQTKDTRFLFERLGFAPRFERSVNWWHASSVGEIQTVWPLLHAIIERSTDDHEQWLITTTTTTGFEVLEQRLKQTKLANNVSHAYFPIDTPGISKRFINRLNPAQLRCVETEIWPNTYTALQNNSIPITIVNARVTKKTLNTIEPDSNFHRILKPAFKHALTQVTVLSRSEDDAAGYRKLGAMEKNVAVLGDLKFADNRPPNCTPPLPNDRFSTPYFVAASTHPTEESDLCEQWMQQTDTGLLVLVPRHVERGPALHTELSTQYGESLAPLRSLGGEPNADHRLYIADTLGELHDWYSGAAAAFVGGSLIDRGGHNVLEPFFHGVPVVTGKHMDNFTDAVQWLTKHHGIHTVSNAADVISALLRFGRSSTRNSVTPNKNLLETYMSHLVTAPEK